MNQNGTKSRPARKPEATREESALGRRLREISDRIAASGQKRLSRAEVLREVASRRGA